MLSQSSVILGGVSTAEGLTTYESGIANDPDSGKTSVIMDGGVGFVPISAASGDFNGDHLADLAVVGTGATVGELVLAIMTDRGNGTFSEIGDYSLAGSNALGNLSTELVETADLGNGYMDIIVYDGSSGNLDVFMGNGRGQFTQSAPMAVNATLIATAVLNNTGRASVIAADGSQMTVLVSNGDGTFAAIPPVTLSGTINSLATADFDGDGHGDIVTNLGVQLGNGDGTFQSPVALPKLSGGAALTGGLAIVDFNGDGNPDIVGLSSAGNVVAITLNHALPRPEITLRANAKPADAGSDVTFTADTPGETGKEQVTFFEDGVELGSGQEVDAGTGLAPGLHLITAEFSGNSTESPGSYDPLVETILAPTKTALSSSENPVGLGGDVTFTATVTGNDGSGDVPSGYVEFFDGATVIGSSLLNGNGASELETTSLPPGTDQITAEYLGDNRFEISPKAAAVSQLVKEIALVPSVVSTTMKSQVIADTPVHSTAKVSLINQTEELITGSAVVTVLASDSGSANGATTMGKVTVAGLRMRPGAKMTIGVPIILRSLSLSAGNYTLLAQVSYGDGTVIDAATGPTLEVIASHITFSNVLTIRQFPLVAIGGSKTRAVATVQMTNQGNIASVGPVTFVLSASTTQGVVGTQIVSVTKTLSIQPGGKRTVTIPLKMLPSLVSGDYFIVLQTTAPNGDTAVVSSATPATVDAGTVVLSASIGSVEPTFVSPGESVSVAVTVINSGNIDADGPMTFDVGISSDGETIDSVVAEVVGKLNLPPESKQSFNINFTIPLAATPGTFYPAVSIDQDGNTASAIGTTRFTIS